MPQWDNTENIRLLNTHYIRLPSNFGVRVYRDSVQSITDDTWEPIEFSHERWDTGITNTYTNGFWDSGIDASQLVATHAGFYTITGHIRFPSDATGNRGIVILLNGVTTIAAHRENAVSDDVTNLSIATLYWLNVGDYVQLVVYQNTGGPLNIDSAGNHSPEFAMVRIP